MHFYPLITSGEICRHSVRNAVRRCPPGHGDIYPSLLGSGMLERLLAAGIKYVFVSNSDNLGATLDLDLLAFFAASDSAFTMEVRRALDPRP